MSKSMTRKGLAIVSATALSLVGLSAPSFGAQADTSKVSLAPSDGTAYAVVDYDGATFSLESNEAVPIVGGSLSWAISGGGLSVVPFNLAAAGTTGDDGTAYETDVAEDFWVRADGVVTFVSSALNGEVDEGDLVELPEGVLQGDDADAAEADVYDRVVVVTDQKDNVATFDTDALTDTWERTDDVVTIDVADLAGLAAGDWIELEGDEFTGDDSVDAGYYLLLSVDGTEATFANAGDDEANKAAQDGETITPLDYFSFADAGEDVAMGDGDVTDAIDIYAYSSAFVEYDADEDILYVDSNVANAAANETLVLYHLYDDADGAAGAEVTVTAWVDDDNDHVIDGTEFASPTRTVSFLTADDLSVASIDWTAPLDALSVSVDVTFSPALNWDQTEELDGVLSNAAGQFAAADATYAEDAGTVTWSATNNNVGANLTLDAGWVTLKTYTTSTNELIATNRFRVEDNDIDDFEIDAVTGSNVAQSDTDADVTVREETTRVVIEVAVVDADDEGIAGIDVVVSDGGASSLDADAEVTVGGEDVDADDGSFDDVTITTNADGIATLVITSTDGTADDALDLDFTAEAETDTVVVTWAEASYNFFYVPAVPADDAAAETTLWLGAGNSTSLGFIAYDQFGVAPAAGMFRVKATIDQDDADGDALDTVYKYGNLSGGQAAVAVTDAAESEENVTVALELQGYDEDGDTWNNDETVAGTIGTDSIDGVTFTYLTGEETDVEVVLDDDEPAAEDTQANADIEAQAWYLGDTDQALVNADGANLTGTVTFEVDGSAYEGGLVTISGSSDLLFGNTNGGAGGFAYAFGSLTAVLDDAGEFDFTVWSNVAGTYTVTITAGGVSDTATVEFNDVADGGANDGVADTTITVSAPAYVMPGSTFIATITLKDEFGNGVEVDAAGAFDVDWDGPGLISGNLPTSTDADGVARVYILFGSNESGSGTLTVTYWGEDGDAAGTNLAGDDAADDNVVSTSTVTLGAEPAPAADTKVNAGSFKGYVAVYAKGYEGKRLSAKVGKDWVVVPALASNFVRVVEYTGAGYTIAVRIYIDRVLVDTITVTTK